MSITEKSPHKIRKDFGMKALTAPLMELGEFEELKKRLEKERACVALTGCVESQKLHMVYGLGEGFYNRLIVTFSDLRVKELLITAFMTGMRQLILPGI